MTGGGFEGLPSMRWSLKGLTEEGDEAWLIRGIARKRYHCPGCHGDVEIGDEHTIVQYVRRLGGTDHHHWHRRCAEEILVPELGDLRRVAANESSQSKLERRGRRPAGRRRREMADATGGARRRRESLPRRVASAYREIVRAYRARGGSILVLALVVFVPLGLLDAGAAELEANAVDFSDGFELAGVLAAAAAVTTTGLLGEVFFAGAISAALTRRQGEPPPPLRRVAREVSYGRLIAVDVLYVLVVAIGLLLAVVPGLAAFVLLGLSGPAVELEDHGVRGALARSVRLVRADFWLVFWVLVPIEVAGDAIGEAAEHLLHGAVGGGFLSAWLAESATNVVLSPFFAVAAVLLTVRLGKVVGGAGPRLRSAQRHGELA